MSAQPKLGKVLTIPEVAAIAGWDRRRMLRHLLRLHDRVRQDFGGSLLHNIGSATRPRWTVTLAALRQVAPAWFEDPNVITRIETLESDMRQVRKLVALHGKAIEAMVA